jgi:hypothetical protein
MQTLTAKADGSVQLDNPMPDDTVVPSFAVEQTGLWAAAAFKDPKKWISEYTLGTRSGVGRGSNRSVMGLSNVQTAISSTPRVVYMYLSPLILAAAPPPLTASANPQTRTCTPSAKTSP